VNLRDDPIAHRYGTQPTTRLLRGIFVHLEENIHPTEFSDRAPLPGTIPQGVHDDHKLSWRDRQPSGELSYSCEPQEATQGCTVAALFGTPSLNCDNTQMTAATMCKSVISMLNVELI
jgi:hypothetical protein